MIETAQATALGRPAVAAIGSWRSFWESGHTEHEFFMMAPIIAASSGNANGLPDRTGECGANLGLSRRQRDHAHRQQIPLHKSAKPRRTVRGVWMRRLPRQRSSEKAQISHKILTRTDRGDALTGRRCWGGRQLPAPGRGATVPPSINSQQRSDPIFNLINMAARSGPNASGIDSMRSTSRGVDTERTRLCSIHPAQSQRSNPAHER